MSDDDYDNYGKVGDAGGVCSTGRSCGTMATRPDNHHWDTNIYARKWGDEYESPWRERKEVRKQNRLDYEAGKNTPAVIMMKENNIKIGRTKREKWEPTETVDDEWVPRKGGQGLTPKRGPYQYNYVPPVEIVKKNIKKEE